MSEVFRKRIPGAPQGYPQWEAAGLSWLADAEQTDPQRPGAATVRVLAVGTDYLDLERLASRPGGPSQDHAAAFGRALAATHAAGAPAFGSGPPSWPARRAGFLGPASRPLPLSCDPAERWGEFFATQRLQPVLGWGHEQGLWSGSDGVLEAVLARLSRGDFDDAAPPSRLHGDLWSGNVLWTPQGGVLIDPAAHGGHHETDLAMLALFGAPHLETILTAYQQAAAGTERALRPGWRDRVPLHQLHPVMLHAVLFGGGYEHQALRLAERVLALA